MGEVINDVESLSLAAIGELGRENEKLHAQCIRYREALDTIANDYRAHARLVGKSWNEAVAWAEGVAKDAMRRT